MSNTGNSKLTAKSFLKDLMKLQVEEELSKIQKYLRPEGSSELLAIGVRMASLFSLAREYKDLPVEEIEELLDNKFYEARMGAVSIMDFQARDKKISVAARKVLFDLYIGRHDRINNWDLVDRAAPYVVGGYLWDKPRSGLYKLAKSKNVWERRTAIVSTYFFIRQNDLADTFKIAALLVHDKHDLIQKAVGSWVREAGKRDRRQLLDFLDRYASTAPRVLVRYAVEKLDKKQRDFYLGQGK